MVTGGVPAITAPNGTITFDTNWTVPASSTVNYTVFGDVSSLAGGDTVTVALGTANVTLLSAATRGTAPTNVTHLAEVVTLGQHAGLQVRDQFDAATSKNDVQLFRFQLVNASASPVTVDQVTFALADVAGLVSGDLTDLRLSDGTAWVSTGGAASITAPNGTITLTGDFTIPASATVNYTLAGDVANLGAGDVLRISLAASDVLLLPAGVATGTTQWVRHVFGTLGPLLAYSDNAVKELRYSRYATGAWDAPGLTGAAATDILYRKVARTRVDQQQQAVVFFDNGYNVGQGNWGRKNLWVSLWDGASWDDTGGAPYGDALNTTTAQWGAIDSDTQGFDAAYESLSGRLLLVSGYNTTGDFYYSLWDGSFWKYYAIQDSTTFPGFDQVFHWVRLVPIPGTNKIVFLGMGWTPAGNTGGMAWAIWNGDTNTWGNTASNTTAAGNTTGDAIAMAVVRGGTNAGDIVTVYGAGRYVYRRIFQRSTQTWTAVTQIADLGAANNPYWLRLKAGPGDDLILGIGTQTGAIYAIPYDGNTRTWRAGGALQLDTTGYGDITQNRPFDVLWDPNGGATNCLAVYSDAGALRYRRSTDGGNSWAAEQNVSASHLAYWVQLDAQPDNLVHLAIADSNDRLNTWTWNGTAWAYENQVSTALEYEDSTPLVRPIEPIAITATPALGSLGGTPTTYYRSIGTAADYQNVGSITVTSGSKSVTGTGTGWKTANRGPGDRLTVGGNHYVISLVNSDTTLTLAAAATASTTTSTYAIARQFATLQAWEDCVSFTVACPYFAVSSSSLVADNRSEIGYAYKDSVLTFATSGARRRS